MVSGTDLGRMLWSFRRIPIVLFTLLDIILKCDSNDKLSPRTMPECLCEVATDTLFYMFRHSNVFFSFIQNI